MAIGRKKSQKIKMKQKADLFKRAKPKPMDVDVVEHAIDEMVSWREGGGGRVTTRSHFKDVDAPADATSSAAAATTPRPAKKLTKKRLLRLQRKQEMRKCYEEKRKKTLAKSGDAMAPPPSEAATSAEPPAAGDAAAAADEAAAPVPRPKQNEKRLRKDDLPLQAARNSLQRRVNQRELAHSNIVTGRRMSKKKARKVINAANRAAREREREAAKMQT